MFRRRQLKSSLKMKKSVIILAFVLALLQLGNSSSIIDSVPENIKENELADVNTHNKINLEDDTEQNKKTVVLLVPVESSEENYDFQDDSEEGESEEKYEETEDVEEIPYHSHKTKRCKSPSSLRKVRRLPALKNSQKYISASTESSIGDSLESPISGKSLFRVASVKDAKKILKNLLKSQPSKREGNDASEIVSKPNKGNNRPKKYICYCVEEDCDMKKPFRPNAVKKRIGPNAFSKSIYSTNYENQEDSSRFLGSERILGTPNNLQCPPGSVLMEEPEYLGQSATQQQKKRRPVKKCPQPILLCDSDSYSLGQPTKIRLPLAGNKKWNRRVYKVDKKSSLAQKLQSAFEKKEDEEREPCTEPETTFNDAQNGQDYYNNEQSNINQYHQIQIDPNLVYPGPYVVYPHYSQHPQYGDGLYNPIPMEPADQGLVNHQEPSLPQYVPSHLGEDDITNSFPLEPANQGFVRYEEPSHNQYVPTQLGEDHLYIPIHLEPKNHGFVGNQVPSPNHYELTPLGRNFVDLDQCIKLFGPNFCIVTTTTISSINGPQYTNNCDDEHENPGIAAQWKDKTHFSTELPQVKTSRYPANPIKGRTHFYGLGATEKDEENVHKSGDYPDNRYEQHRERIPLKSGFYYVTKSPYSSRPLNLKFPTSDGILKTATPNYDNIGSKHEEESRDFEDYENSVDPESPIKHGNPNSEYLVPTEDYRESESDDYSVNSESDFNEVIQKRPQESITKIPVTAIRQNLQGAHRISSPRYFEYTVKPGAEDTNTFSKEDSEDSLEHGSKFIQTAQYSNLPNYDRSKVLHSTNEPRNEEPNESATLRSGILKIGIPDDDSRSALRIGSQNERKFSNLQRVPTAYPIYDNGDHTTSTSLRIHPSHRYNDNVLSSKYDVYHSTVPEEAGLDFQPHIPKATNSQRQFVGITQTTPADHYSKPEFVPSASIDSKNYYATMQNLGYSTMSLLGKGQPEEHTYASENHSNVNDAVEIVENNTEKVPMITTQSRLDQQALNKYFTTKTHSYHQSKQPKSNFEAGIAKTTIPHRNFVGRTQSIPVNKFSKPGIVSSATVGGNDRYTTSYASMADLRNGYLRNEPEKRIYSSTIYPTMNAKETLHNIPEYEEIGTGEARSQIENTDNKYFTSPRTLYPQLVGSHQSTQPSQVGENLETRKMNSPFVQSITQSPLNEFAKSGTTFDAGTSYATMEDLRYNTPLLGVNEPEQRDEYSIKQIPSSLHHNTQSHIPNTNQNKSPNAGKVTSSQRQFVGVAQSTPQNVFPQPGIASIETTSGNSHYTTSYATMEDTEHTTTSILRANEPEEEIFRSSSYPTIHGDEELKTVSSWAQENEKQHQNNIEETAWTQYYPTQSGVQDQDFTTDRNYYPQFVGSHKSTNGVSSSTDLYPERYFTTDANSYPQFDSQTPEDVMNSYKGQSRNWHHSTANQKVTSGRNPHRQFVASHHSTPGEIVSTTTTGSNLVRMPARDSSKTYWPSTTERSEKQYFPTLSKRPFATDNRRSTTEQDNLGMKISSEDDYSNEDIRNRYTSTTSILNSGRSNPSGSSNELFGPSEDMDSKMPEKTLGNSIKQSEATPNVEFDSGIKEESNAYFTSLSYDNNIDRVTGPDSYFESGGLKNWNDFTSMSSNEFTIGDINRAEGIKQPKIIDGMNSEEEGLQTTEVSPRHTTYYEVVGEELPYKEHTINEESHPDDSNNPISETHYFKSHSTSPQILEREYNVLDKHSTENFNSEENVRQNLETTTVAGNTNAFDYDDGNNYSSIESNNLTSMKKIEGKDSSAVSSTEDDSIHSDKSSDIKKAMMQHQSESSEKVQLPFSNDRIMQPDDVTKIPNRNQPLENYDYTNDYSSMEKIAQTELAQNHDDYMSSEAYLPSKNSESVGAPFTKTASNMLGSSTTIRSVNYNDYGDFDEPHKIALQPNYIQKHPVPTVDLTHEISNMNQLLPKEKYILRTAAELAVNELVSASPGKMNTNCQLSPDAVGAPNQGLLPGLPELPILKNLFSLPEVKDMAINTIKGLLSNISGVPPDSSLGRLSDHLINSVLNGVINNVFPGPVTTTSSGMVDEHRFENGQWTVVPVPLVPNDDQVALTHDDKIFGIMENIIRRIGVKGAKSPAVQNIIVQTVENILNKAKYIADHSVLWDVLDKVITRAEEPGTSFRKTPEIVKPINKVPDIRKPGRIPFRKPSGIVKPINKVPDIRKPGGTSFRKPPGIVKPINKLPDIKKSGGTFKTLPVIPIVEHVVKNGEWSEKHTVLGDKRKNFDLPTDNEDHLSMPSYKTANPASQFGHNTKPVDYAFMGDSEEDDETTQENYNPNVIVGMAEKGPTTVNQIHNNDEDLENSPIKYYSPNDRILSYIKNHQNPAVIVGTQQSNEFSPTTADSVKFAQPTQPGYDRLSSGSEEPSVGSPKKKICTCKEVDETANGERISSGLRESQVLTEDDNYSELPSNIHNLDENYVSATENFVGKEKSPTTVKSHKNSREKLDSTESSVASSTIHHLDVNDEGSNDYTTEEYVENENPSATKEIDQNSEEEEGPSIEMTESNESSHSSPVYVYGVPVGNTQIPEGKSGSDEKTGESTNKEYISASNTLTTEKIDQNSEEVGNEMTENKESHGFSDVPEEILEAGNHRQSDQSISTPVFVYGVPVGNTQFPESTSRSKEQSEESTNKENIGATNVLTTETLDHNSEEVTNEMTETNESRSFSDVNEDILETDNHEQTDQSIGTSVFVYGNPVGNTQFPESTIRSYTKSEESEEPSDITEEILEAENDRQIDPSITTPVYVYGLPILEKDRVGNTNLDESTTENLRHQFVEALNPHDATHHATTSISTKSEGISGNTQFPGFQNIQSHLGQGVDGQSEESITEEYINQENAFMTDSEDNPEIETSIESTESREPLSDVTSEILLAGSNKNTDYNDSTRVYVNGVPAEESTTQELTKISKNYGSPQEASTSSQGLIGAARSRIENPRQRLDRPRDKIVKQSQISSGSSSKCVTPKYDPTYFGKISLNGVNPGGDSISDLTNSDLFYVGDGVKLPLTIKRMPDGSFALTISEKICENFVKRKCPCCVPREGDVIEEKRQSDEAEDDEYIDETRSQENENYDSFEPTESTEFSGKSKRRFVRSTSGSEVLVTSATPVEKFVKKYNLTLSLDDNTPLVNRRNNDDDKIKNTKRTNRLNSSKDTKIRNLFENNNEIQRDDSKETEKRAIDDDSMDTDLRESNSIRKAEYTYDTGTNDFFQSLLHIKDVPEEKRTEIVLNALDGLVNSASEKIRMDHFGNSVEEDQWEDDDQWEGSDEYDLNEMENEMAKYGYQKDNPILERIRFIKAQQNSHGQYKYQKNIDHRARGKMNMLKTVLHWLRELFLETKFDKPS